MAEAPSLLARGPWSPEQVEASWREDRYVPDPALERRADEAVRALRERGSPCHDGLSGRLVRHTASTDRLTIELQPSRWALRLVEEDSAGSVTVLCLVRDTDGRWLAGRRAGWVATWAGRWALGAGGAVDVGESPVDTLSRELHEEWRLVPERLSVEALVALPGGMAMLVGLATVAAGSEPVLDPEHSEFAWWDADPGRWPEEEARLRPVARLVAG